MRHGGMRNAAQAQTTIWSLTRTGTLPDVRSLTDRAQGFTGSLGKRGSAVLLVVRTADGLASFLLSRSVGRPAAFALANAVAARADEVESLPPLASDFVVRADVDVTHPTDGSNTQVGNPDEVALSFPRTLTTEGAWAALAIRRPSNLERRRWSRWAKHQYGNGTGAPQHHSLNSGAVIVSMFAGGPTADGAEAVLSQATATMPGFDANVRMSRVSAGVWRRVALLDVAAAAMPAATVALNAPHVPVVAGFVAGMPFAAVAALTATGKWKTAGTRVLESVKSGELPTPGRVLIPPRKPVKEHVKKDEQTGTQWTVPASPGGFPITPTAHIIGPALVACFIAPHHGAGAVAGGGTHRETPAELVTDIGPRLGLGVDGQPVHIDIDMLFGGIGVVGAMGSGKSVLVRSAVAQIIAARNSNAFTRLWASNGGLGQGPTIVIETKGAGAAKMAKWCRSVGVEPLVIDVADPSTPGLEMLAGDGNAAERASDIVAVLANSFEEGSIQNASRDAMKVLLEAVLASPELDDRNPMLRCSVLTGNFGDEAAVEHAKAIINAAQVIGASEELKTAGRQLLKFFGPGRSQNTRISDFKAISNKFSQLVAIGQWWDRPERYTWRSILDWDGPVIINTGSVENNRPGAVQVDERTAELLATMLLATLRKQIERQCSGWFNEGRAVTVVADEAKDVAALAPEVLVWLVESGREFGVQVVLATQRLELLPKPVQDTLLGLKTVAWMQSSSADVAERAAKDLSAGGHEWTASEIINLDRYTAVVRTQVAGKRRPPVAIAVENFETGRQREVLA